MDEYGWNLLPDGRKLDGARMPQHVRHYGSHQESIQERGEQEEECETVLWNL